MVVMGVTGGVASGKSLVAETLRRLGAQVVDADRWGHEVLREPAVREALCARWGPGVLDAEGEICRSAVAERVFAPPPDGPRELAFLERCTHPRITARLEQLLCELAGRDDVPAVVLDAPLLHQAGWGRYCHVILFVEADRASRAERALERGWSESHWRAREAAQPSLAYQRGRADVRLDNSGSREDLVAQVETLWQTQGNCSRPVIFGKLPFTKASENS